MELSKRAKVLLCLFLGLMGIHRLAMGYTNWWVMLLTCGGCGFWYIYDLVRIIKNKM